MGQKEANFLNKSDELIGFQLNKTQLFNQIYTTQIKVTYNEQQNEIIIVIPKSSKSHLNKLPKNASHFILTSAVSLVSSYKWVETVKAYRPLHPNQNDMGAITQSQSLLVNNEYQDIQMQVQLPTYISTKIALSVWLGINYLKEVNGEFIELETIKAMECIAIL